MYPDCGYKRAHVQSVCSRPFSHVGRGLETRLAPAIPKCLYVHVEVASSPGLEGEEREGLVLTACACANFPGNFP